MPFVQVYYPEILSHREELKMVSKHIHGALMEHFHIPSNDYFQMFIPYSANLFFFDMHYLLDGENKRTENMMVISITCGPGRTTNQKKKLYQSIADSLANLLNITTSDTFIILNETPAENWSFGQGLAQMVQGIEE